MNQTYAFVHGVNFCRITDYSKSQYVPLNALHFLGLHNLTFDLTLSTFTSSSRYVSGGRLYLETRQPPSISRLFSFFFSNSILSSGLEFENHTLPEGLVTNKADGQFVDFYDWNFPPVKAPLSEGTVAGIAIGSVAGLLLFAGFGFFLYRRSKTPAPPAPPAPATQPPQ